MLHKYHSITSPQTSMSDKCQSKTAQLSTSQSADTAATFNSSFSSTNPNRRPQKVTQIHPLPRSILKLRNPMFRRMIASPRQPLQRIRNINNYTPILRRDVPPLLGRREKKLKTPSVVEQEGEGSAVGMGPVADVGETGQ